MSNKARNINFDLMRLYVVLLVIYVHAERWIPFTSNPVKQIAYTYAMQCNNIFFMLSGYFNLEYTFPDMDAYRRFYRKRTASLFLPYLVSSLILFLWDLFRDGTLLTTGIVEGLRGFYEAFMQNNMDTHIWFMYPMIGFMLSTPFLSKLLHSLSGKELKLLWYMSLGWLVVRVYLCTNLGISFYYSGWLIVDHMINFLAGYYYRHAIVNESRKKWFVLGAASFAAICAGRIFFPDYVSFAFSFNALYIFFTVSCFMFWDGLKLHSERFGKVTGFLCRYTFYIYMFHMNVLHSLHFRLVRTDTTASILLLVPLTFLASLPLAIVTDLALKPVQKWILSSGSLSANRRINPT